MKKNVFFKILIAVLVLTSILLSSLLGVTKSEYFKTFSKSVDIETKSDLMLEYYLNDANTPGTAYTDGEHNSDTYHEKSGVYKDAENILQPIVVGKKDIKTVSGANYYFGDSIIYQIRVPVDESGYYTLDFTVDFLLGPMEDEHKYEPNKTNLFDGYNHPENQYYDDNFFTMSHEYCMGCEVLNADDGFTFGKKEFLDMSARISATDTYKKSYAEEPIYYSDSAVDSVYQWKTLTPSRAEKVKLAFKATDKDVARGYVIWAWDFTGIKGNHNYRLSITGLEIEKTMELDGTTKYRTNDDPYFMFPQTSFTNDATYSSGSEHGGRAYYSRGRGTFVTEATANSLGMRSEVLLKYHGNGNGYLPETPNPVSIQIPLKNINYDTTYKVTFDFSVARQGNQKPENDDLYNSGLATLFDKVTTEKLVANNHYDYTDFTQIFTNSSSETQFGAYLYSTKDLSTIGYTADDHKANKAQIKYNHKQLVGSDYSLVNYNDVTRFNTAQDASAFAHFPDYTTTDIDGCLNDTFSAKIQSGTFNGVKVDATKCRNWFNAVQHTEQIAQQGINWITFYNTTFSFNIDGDAHQKKDDNGNLLYLDENGDETTTVTDKPAYNIDLDDLYWVWQIEALEYYGWYNIRIDNVRIEKVVQYSSELNNNGVKIANTAVGLSDMTYYGDKIESINNGNGDAGVFSNLRGWNGTGQNCNPRGFDQTNYYSAGHIYAPIIDAKKLAAAPGGGKGATDYKIYLDGMAVCKSGIYKYVYSADGGKTWYDMTFEGDDSVDLAYAEQGIEQNTKMRPDLTLNNTNFVEFKESDGDNVNSNFSGFKLIADLSPYKNQSDLDIIIAAVPNSDRELRCEILRIINYHAANMYVSKVESISSDITVKDTSKADAVFALTKTTNDFSITSVTSGNSDYWPFHYYPVSDRGVFQHNTGRSEPIVYSDLQTTVSDIPVKTTLTVKGGIVCSGGVSEYAFSVDNGKTWNKITSRTGVYHLAYSTENDISHDDLQPAPTAYEILLHKYLTRNWKIDGTYFEKRNGAFNTEASKLTIDLSKYVGQVVDVIVAAKPTAMYKETLKSDIYLPVAKIDSVAVYGENGTFYSRLINVSLQQTDGTSTTVTRVHEGVDGKLLNGKDKWNIPGGTNYSIGEDAYTIFEPYNVDILQTRKCNNIENYVVNGGLVKIEGFMVCHGGVSKYKFSLNHGQTWMDINQNAGDSPEAFINAGKLCDSTFDMATDKTNSNYSTVGGGIPLEFYLPAQPDGSVKDLLVVAESPSGKLYPVLNITLKIVAPNVPSGQDPTSTFAFFSRDERNKEVNNGIKWGSERRTDLNWTFIPGASSVNGVNTARYRFTFPVSQTGVHTLSMDAELGYYPIAETQKKANSTIYQADATVQYSVGSGTVEMSVEKTRFLVGEPINVTYSATYTGTDTKYNNKDGVLKRAMIGIVSLDENGEDIIKYDGWGRFERAYIVVGDKVSGEAVNDKVALNGKGSVSGTIDLTDKTKTITSTHIPNVNFGNFSDLPAGHYRIFFCNDTDIGIGNIIDSEIAYNYLRLTDPIDITIYDNEGTIGTLPVHDYNYKTGEEIENSYYNNISSQVNIDDFSTDVKIDTSTTAWVENEKPFGNHSIELTYNVTEEDVLRGYVIFDWDLTQLEPGITYYLNLDNIYFTSGVKCDHVYKDGYCINCGIKEPFVVEGEYLYFGEYPQSLKLDEVTVDENNKDYRGYYLGSDKNYYAKVIANPCGNDYTFATNDTRVENGKVYYFKVEPIKWRIVAQEGNIATVICESIIANKAFDITSNNYADSDVREWLNSNFYQNAFDSFPRSLIQLTEVDNSVATTGYASNSYACLNTTDSIYLPSYADVINTAYKFSAEPFASDEKRMKSVTDYAIATGAYISLSEWGDQYGNGIWLTRSPSDQSSLFVRQCMNYGEIDDGGISVKENSCGVVPMLRVKLEK